MRSVSILLNNPNEAGADIGSSLDNQLGCGFTTAGTASAVTLTMTLIF